MPGDGHAGCGRRSGETHQQQCWQGAPGRPHNLVHDPATLIAAFDRVAGNRGARTPGVDGLTAADVEEQVGVPGFLNDLRTQLRQGSFRPLPVRERKIPKPGGSGKVRRLGIPVIADRVVQAALKLVLEPIFEADFKPVSYGFRPKRRAQDAIAEIHFYGTHGYRWVLDADIAACFDEIEHVALMNRVRKRIKDKRVLALVKAFLKSGLFTELGEHQETFTGTPQGNATYLRNGQDFDVRRVRVAGCGFGWEFLPVGVDVDAFDGAWATAVPPAGVESFNDFRACRLKGVHEVARGKSPPGP